ncbi:MAG TPA: hypothetical protein PKW08_02190 [Flavobacteriaceae bacterium]|nr:hypothetical protein [Flavobacteriaceae bacterium]HPF10882.1 hypothetical protein [Flavobacteriaceae bacterium]HQU20375.1 hypothetical protein [Flavobacteriaceae bacterium]HQU64267.1 hypothetical protein [Flavobacteriaceae bacterium]HRW44278.1 hypothetical protein [Flavobacteriaceae bacterium]
MKQLASLFLSVLILLSSTGITYARHYCLGHEMLAKVTLGEEPLSCGMAMPVSACGDELQAPHGCCSNDYLKVVTDQQFAKVAFNFNFDVQWLPTVPVVLAEPQVVFIATPSTQYPTYRPPPLLRDLQVWYKTFLI